MLMSKAGSVNGGYRKQRILKSMRRRGTASEGGIALMMVLWVLVLLMIIAMNFLNAGRWNSAAIHNLKEDTMSYYMAVSGYQEALFYLMSDKDPTIDFLDSDGNFWVDAETQPVTGLRKSSDGETEIRIIDEDSKLNINYAIPDDLIRLFEFCGVPQETIPEIIDSILDWKDSGDQDSHHLLGAEDDYYASLEDPYKAKNGLFDVPEELSLVKGMKTEYLYGSEGVRPLLSFITTFGRGGMNINTVSPEVLELLGLNPAEIEAVLKQRSPEAGGFRFVPQEFARYGLRAVSSYNLRIEVTARANGERLAEKISAVVNRKASTKGYKIQTVYWREGAENTGS